MSGDQVCLIVDDVEFDRRMMRRVMAKHCPEMPLIVARNLGEARARLRSENVSILFLDNALPDGMGVDFLSELNADKTLNHVPVIIVSDFPSPFMYAKAQAAQVCEVWSKREFIGSAVRRVMQKHVRLH
ncbi:chemotaxis-specific methylesterase [Antarctobacter heliothermus]|uniref:Chemotaxis-specific methylesterase n=1 Tax=Antarctobacter heliothermus TaxID=74033 RepID=A0A222E7W3_9RHOB|nr:response regulator [Antarctobacter heliothermus]ASP22262.1 chemotaxis-specific methylesterase [Antarctobacter heliothermus]